MTGALASSVAADIFPLEVKAGKTGKLKSLKLFIKEKKSRFGIRISQENFSYYDNVLSVPFYLIEQLPRLIQSVRAIPRAVVQSSQ